jgi:hypothetical protein
MPTAFLGHGGAFFFLPKFRAEGTLKSNQFRSREVNNRTIIVTNIPNLNQPPRTVPLWRGLGREIIFLKIIALESVMPTAFLSHGGAFFFLPKFRAEGTLKSNQFL